MRKKNFWAKIYLWCFLLVFPFFMFGCINIEQEIFFNSDGSGEFVMHFSVPEMPSKDPMTDAKEFDELKKGMEEMKAELTKDLPAGLEVKEVKFFSKNQLWHFYIIYKFKDIKLLTTIATKKDETGKGIMLGADTKDALCELVKDSGNTYTFRYILNLDLSSATQPEEKEKVSPPAGEKAPGSEEEASFEEMGKEIAKMMLSTCHLKFVVHTLGEIKNSNADVVLQNKNAVWDYSLANFIEPGGKKIEMTVTFNK